MTAGPEQLLDAGGVRLCVQAFGSPDDPPVLLVAGAAQSMVWWEDGFCRRLAAAGRLVVRYDHRDTGRSTASPAGSPSYTGEDLATDPLRVLDALDLPTAHLVGLSLGAGVAQCIAVTAPERLRTLTLVSSSPAGPYDGPPLPPPEPRLLAALRRPPPDWSDPAAALGHRVEAERPYAGTLGFDEPRVRRLAALEVARTTDLAAAMTNHVLLDDPWPPGARLQDVRVPTLVLHGTADPLFPPAHGRALAALVPGARLVELEGVGHQQPPPQRWDVALRALVEHTGARTVLP